MVAASEMINMIFVFYLFFIRCISTKEIFFHLFPLFVRNCFQFYGSVIVRALVPYF